MLSRTLFASLLLTACALGAPLAAASAPLPKSPVDPARLSQDIKVLASDAFEGRGPGTRAEAKVIDYVVERFKALKLEPAGDNGGWTQAVPLRRFSLAGPISLAMTVDGRPQSLVQGDQIVVMTKLPVDHVAVQNAPLVFVGYGVQAPERGWDDFKGADLRGKIAVVLINDPDFEARPGDGAFGRFDGRSETYYGRWTYKYEEAARMGALGVLIVHETAPAAYGWPIVKNSNIIPQFDIVRPDPRRSHPLIEGWVQRDVAVDLFRASGLDFETMKREARQADFRPVALKNVSFSADYGVETTTVTTHNIAAKLPGAVRPNDTVLYSAHWDHLGIGPPDSRGDRIYNGAVDNASGVAGLLELARLFAQAPRPERTVAFLAVTAEEKGLLGSEYYAEHPLFPLARTVADLNLDGLQTAGPARDVQTQGDGKSTLEDLIAAEAQRQGRVLARDAHLEEGHFFRADHFPLAKVGVPAVTLQEGVDLYAGGVAAGEAAHREYLLHHYHQPADEWSPNWDLRGAAIDLALYYAVGRKLADSTVWPGWKPGSEFRARREASAGDRAGE